jgi:P27 family predicted phage terminase small subunit
MRGAGGDPMRGRKPTPTALKVLRGNPGRRPLNKREPAPARAVDLTPPPELTGAAAAEWARLAPKLQRLGLLTEIDDRALIAYCVTWARWLEAEQELRDHGMVLKGRRGAPFLSPYVKIAATSLAQLKAWIEQFGMTPSARSRVKTDPGEQPADPFTKYDHAEPWPR